MEFEFHDLQPTKDAVATAGVTGNPPLIVLAAVDRLCRGETIEDAVCRSSVDGEHTTWHVLAVTDTCFVKVTAAKNTGDGWMLGEPEEKTADDLIGRRIPFASVDHIILTGLDVQNGFGANIVVRAFYDVVISSGERLPLLPSGAHLSGQTYREWEKVAERLRERIG